MPAKTTLQHSNAATSSSQIRMTTFLQHDATDNDLINSVRNTTNPVEFLEKLVLSKKHTKKNIIDIVHTISLYELASLFLAHPDLFEFFYTTRSDESEQRLNNWLTTMKNPIEFLNKLALNNKANRIIAKYLAVIVPSLALQVSNKTLTQFLQADRIRTNFNSRTKIVKSTYAVSLRNDVRNRLQIFKPNDPDLLSIESRLKALAPLFSNDALQGYLNLQSAGSQILALLKANIIIFLKTKDPMTITNEEVNLLIGYKEFWQVIKKQPKLLVKFIACKKPNDALCLTIASHQKLWNSVVKLSGGDRGSWKLAERNDYFAARKKLDVFNNTSSQKDKFVTNISKEKQGDKIDDKLAAVIVHSEYWQKIAPKKIGFFRRVWNTLTRKSASENQKNTLYKESIASLHPLFREKIFGTPIDRTEASVNASRSPLSSQLAHQEREKITLKQINDKLAVTNMQLTHELTAANNEKKAAATKAAELQENLVASQANEQALFEEVKMQEAAIAQLNSTHAALVESKQAETGAMIAALESQLAAQEREQITLKQINAKIAATNVQLTHELTTANNEKTAAATKAAELQANLVTSQAREQDLTKDVKMREAAIAQLNITHTALVESKQAETGAIIAAFESQLAAQAKEQITYQQINTELDATIAQLLEELATADNEKAAAAIKTAELKANLATSQTNEQALEANNALLTDELTVANNKRTAIAIKADELQANLVTSQAREQDLTKDVKMREAAIAQLHITHAALVESMQAEAHTIIVALESELANALETKQGMQAEYALITDELNIVTEAKDKAQSEIENLKTEMADMKEQHDAGHAELQAQSYARIRYSSGQVIIPEQNDAHNSAEDKIEGSQTLLEMNMPDEPQGDESFSADDEEENILGISAISSGSTLEDAEQFNLKRLNEEDEAIICELANKHKILQPAAAYLMNPSTNKAIATINFLIELSALSNPKNEWTLLQLQLTSEDLNLKEAELTPQLIREHHKKTLAFVYKNNTYNDFINKKLNGTNLHETIEYVFCKKPSRLINYNNVFDLNRLSTESSSALFSPKREYRPSAFSSPLAAGLSPVASNSSRNRLSNVANNSSPQSSVYCSEQNLLAHLSNEQIDGAVSPPLSPEGQGMGRISMQEERRSSFIMGTVSPASSSGDFNKNSNSIEINGRESPQVDQDPPIDISHTFFTMEEIINRYSSKNYSFEDREQLLILAHDLTKQCILNGECLPEGAEEFLEIIYALPSLQEASEKTRRHVQTSLSLAR